MPFPEIPDILKQANWNKEKGKLAKMFGGETGLGAQMEKLRKSVDALDLAKCNVAQAYKSMQELEKSVAEAKKELAKTAPVRQEAYALRDLAKKVAGDFKKNRMIPSSSTAHVEKIAAEADLYGVAIKSYDPTTEFANARQKLQNTLKIQTEVVKKGHAACVEALKVVAKTKPLEWPNDAWQKVRAMSAAVARSPELADVQADWKTLSSKGPDKVKGPEATTKHLQALDKLLQETLPLLK